MAFSEYVNFKNIFSFELQGLTKSLIESPPTADGIHISDREMATSVGYVLGFLFGGFLLSRFSRNFIMLLTLQVIFYWFIIFETTYWYFFYPFLKLKVLGSMLITVPWISSDWSTDTVYIIIGVSLAILMIGKLILFCMYKVHMFREGLKKWYVVGQYPTNLPESNRHHLPHYDQAL